MRRLLIFLSLALLAPAAIKGVKLGSSKSAPSASMCDVNSDSFEEDDAVTESQELSSVNMQWILQQAGMYQMRVAVLSGELEKKGYPVKAIIPQPRGLVCAQSTAEHPLRCRVYMEPDRGSKVVSPCKCKGTQKWIAIRALNQQRRRDPLKWLKCPICQSHIDYDIFESHIIGLERIPTEILNHRTMSRFLIVSTLILFMLILAVVFDGFIIRSLTSSVLWGNWDRITGLAGSGLTLYIICFQFARKRIGKALTSIEDKVRIELTELESSILERCLPTTMSAKEAEELMGMLK